MNQELQKAIERAEGAAEELLKKSEQMSLFGDSEPHHVGYTRTSSSGTVSVINPLGLAPTERQRKKRTTITRPAPEPESHHEKMAKHHATMSRVLEHEADNHELDGDYEAAEIAYRRSEAHSRLSQIHARKAKSEMTKSYQPPRDSIHHPNHNAGKMAKYASDAASQATDRFERGTGSHETAARMHEEAAESARSAGQHSIAEHHDNMATHHRAYTRTNSSGTVSNIAQKGTAGQTGPQHNLLKYYGGDHVALHNDISDHGSPQKLAFALGWNHVNIKAKGYTPDYEREPNDHELGDLKHHYTSGKRAANVQVRHMGDADSGIQEAFDRHMDSIRKSHVRSYTGADGTVVQEHEDSRTEAQQASRKAMQSGSAQDHFTANG